MTAKDLHASLSEASPQGEQDIPLLSIIIPTRNRKEYAASAIRSILSIPSEDFELIVQDNSDNDELLALLASQAHDTRL
ncbi:Spore coat polysaccharide biosynthesis protein SpsA [compost metagenome]